MRTTTYMLNTLKNVSKKIKSNSHKLMLRSGMIRKISSGIYTWLPTGVRVLNKVTKIIKKEMNKIKALEIQMPILQPSKIWKKSNRWKDYGKELFKLSDRKKSWFVLGPTHEEIVTELVKNEIHSYKNLPILLYQIQQKFRDEIRPRFGVIRSREFIMKDAYSFHLKKKSLQKTYFLISKAYEKIFKKMNLKYKLVQAHSAKMGGTVSHEFQAIIKNGEDKIAICKKSKYAANIEIAPVVKTTKEDRLICKKKINQKKNNTFLKNLKLLKKKKIKIIFVKSSKRTKKKIIALLIHNHHTINQLKVQNLKLIENPFSLIKIKNLQSIHKTSTNFLKFLKKKTLIIIDVSISHIKNFTLIDEINQTNHYNLNWNKDIKIEKKKDIRNIETGDLSPNKKGVIKIKNCIEIGHIFQLNQKYSKMINAKIIDKNKSFSFLKMGCYGIGITRVISAIIEQNYDKNGIIWPKKIAPFNVAIVPINMHSNILIKKISEQLFYKLKKKNLSVIFDDRKKRLGNMLHDMELIGIPFCIIVSPKNLKKDAIELIERSKKKKKIIKIKNISKILKKKFYK